MVAMFEQFWPSGQQRPDEELSSDMQFVPDGHLKLLGRFGSTAEHEESSCLRRTAGNLGGFERPSEANVKGKRIGTIKKRRIIQILDRKYICGEVFREKAIRQ